MNNLIASLLVCLSLSACASSASSTRMTGATDTGPATVLDASTTDVAQPEEATIIGECVLGETRHCYSGPSGTENVGQCRGSTQICYRGVDGMAHWPSPIDCVGEITPYPFGDMGHDGIDNDCNGLVDDDSNLHRGRERYCHPTLGCFWFGNAPENPWAPIYGFQGCFTSGRFRPLEGVIRPGMLISTGGPDELHRVYYVTRDGRRHIFPTATTFASWYLDPSSRVPIHLDAHACAQVIQVSPEQLATIQLGQNVTIRPGTVAIGITTDPARYVISLGGTLRRIGTGVQLTELQPPWLTERIVMVADAFFVNYQVGAEITNPSTYHWPSEYAVTLDDNLAATR